MFRSGHTIIRESILSLIKITFFVDTISKNMSLLLTHYCGSMWFVCCVASLMMVCPDRNM